MWSNSPEGCFSSLPRSPSGVTLKEVERDHIQWALEQTAGKIRGPGGAAELLNIHYRTLRSRMAKPALKGGMG
ncbi:MAG: helix-turn-helix domain-containing protein [Deltaproteobacteria bacterium]|nr:helix-turn-helix domain-containing protein [Deltaproteobacteria bacterium]